jgi:hypothetical protein
MMRIGWIALVVLLSRIAFAQTARPTISTVSPCAGQRGTTVTVTFSGINLAYGTRVVFESPGLTAGVVRPDPAPDPNAKNPDGRLAADIQIAPDAPLGPHTLRIVTSKGVSEPALFTVGIYPETMEREPNNTRAQAQPIVRAQTIVGRSDGAEDIDWYRVPLVAGETFVAHIQTTTVGSVMEPILTLVDERGRDVAGGRRFGADTILSYTAPHAGETSLSVRDLRYGGGAAYFYCLTVGPIPLLTGVFPAGGPAGAPIALSAWGPNLPTGATVSATLPGDVQTPLAPVALTLPGGAVQTTLLHVGDAPERDEVEPNDAAQPQRVELPAIVNGRLQGTGAGLPDTDGFRFAATKGQTIELEVLAGRLGSPVDAVLTVRDATGRELASNDDARGRDPFLAFTAPDDGEFVAVVSERTGRSGPDCVYRLRLVPAVADFSLTFAPDTPAVGPGDRVPLIVTAARRYGFDGAIGFTVEGLLPGVHLEGVPTILPGQTEARLFLTADPGASIAAGALRVIGTAGTLVRRAGALQENYVRRDDRVERTTRPVSLPMIAITDGPDLTVSTAAQTLTLAPGKTAELLVTIQRKTGFGVKVPLIVVGLPAGVTVTGTDIAENASEAKLTFTAEATAAVGSVVLTVIARSLVDELRFREHVAAPVRLSIIAP